MPKHPTSIVAESHFTRFPSWLLLLQARLIRAICLQKDFLPEAKFNCLPDPDGIGSYNIEAVAQGVVKRAQSVDRLVYVSAIAHRLSAQVNQPATLLATHLVDCVLQDTPIPLKAWVHRSLSHCFWQDVRIQVLPVAVIQFEIGDRAIAAWLDLLIQHPPQQPQAHLFPAPAAAATHPLLGKDGSLFALQHAHARCCSLLKLAHREQLIHLAQAEQPPLAWRFADPVVIPWLTGTDQLILNHPSALHLVGQLVTVIDALATGVPTGNRKHWLRLANAVSQAFHQFHRDRPLLAHPTKPTNVQVAAQLGLIMATQRVLRLLLEDVLGVFAPVEL